MKSLKLFICAVWILAFFGTRAPVKAQQPAPTGNQIQNGPIEALLGSQKKKAEARINARISDLKYAVKLSPHQVAKLNATREAAVTAYISKTQTMLANEFKPDAEIDFSNTFTMFRLMGSPNSVENETTWTSSVDSVLTDEQATKLRRWNAKRIAVRDHLTRAQQALRLKNQGDAQQIAVRQFVARADDALLLTPEQKEQLALLVNEKFGRQLAGLPFRIDDSDFPWHRDGLAASGIVNEIDYNTNSPRIDAVLSESQAILWEHGLGLELFLLERNERLKRQRTPEPINA